MKHVGDALRVKLLRGGAELEAAYALARQHPLVGVLHEVDCLPSYLVVGGLVFAPLSLPILEAAYSARKWRALAPVAVLKAFQEQRASPDQQVVILVQVLSHEVNHGYKLGMAPLERFNGAPVGNLRELAAAVDAALAGSVTAAAPAPAAAAPGQQGTAAGDGGSASGTAAPACAAGPAAAGAYLNFEFEGGRWVTLDAAQVRRHGADVLRANAIPRDRSDDLLAPPAPPATSAVEAGAASSAAGAAAASNGGGAGGGGDGGS